MKRNYTEIGLSHDKIFPGVVAAGAATAAGGFGADMLAANGVA